MSIIKKVILTAYLNEIADNVKAKAIGRGATYEGVKERTCKDVADAWQELQDALEKYRRICIAFSNSDASEFDFKISAPNNTVMQEVERIEDGKFEGF